jgi:hypothetical protein
MVDLEGAGRLRFHLHDLALDEVSDHCRHQSDRLDVLQPRERERRLRQQEVAGKDRELRTRPASRKRVNSNTRSAAHRAHTACTGE